MTLQEIQKLVEHKNEALQRELEQEAHSLIERIAELQTAKAQADVQIAECREKLQKLAQKPLTIAEVLGQGM